MNVSTANGLWVRRPLSIWNVENTYAFANGNQSGLKPGRDSAPRCPRRAVAARAFEYRGLARFRPLLRGRGRRRRSVPAMLFPLQLADKFLFRRFNKRFERGSVHERVGLLSALESFGAFGQAEETRVRGEKYIARQRFQLAIRLPKIFDHARVFGIVHQLNA